MSPGCVVVVGLLQGAELGRAVIDPAEASLLPGATLSRIRF
jgi:hypothetical protein